MKTAWYIIAKLKMSAGINNLLVPYKVDKSSNGNIMPLQSFKKIFSRITSEELVATKNESIKKKHITKHQ